MEIVMSKFKLLQEYETDIFVSKAGCIYIQQYDCPDPQQTIILTPHQVRKAIEILNNLLVYADDVFFSVQEINDE
jgi:hypothetical protein